MEEEREDAEESTDFIGEQTNKETTPDVTPADADPAGVRDDCMPAKQEEIVGMETQLVETEPAVNPLPEWPNSSVQDTQPETDLPEEQPAIEIADIVENEESETEPATMDSGENVAAPPEANAVSGSDETNRQESGNGGRSRLVRYLGVSAAVLLMGVIGGVMFYFYRQNHTLLNMDNVAPMETVPIAATNEKEEIQAGADSLSVKRDTLVAKPVSPAPKTDTTRTIITGVRKGRESVIADSTSYRIVGTMTTYKLKAGETLTMVSRRFYETKDLWPYLVMHNRDVIVNPNNVPVGTVLRIPALRNK